VVPSLPMEAKKTAKRAKKTAATPKKAAAKKTGRGGRRGPRGPRAGSKTSFILSQPLDAPAKDVVDAGAKAGHSFDVKYVYAIRSANRGKAGAAAAPAAGAAPVAKRGPGRPRKNAGANGALTVSGSLESQFARMAVDLGIARAESILRKVRDQLDRMTF
jgi:hypothetical protein